MLSFLLKSIWHGLSFVEKNCQEFVHTKKNDIKYSVFFHAEFGMTPGLIARNEAANLRHASGSFSSAAGIKGCNDIVDKIIYLLIKRLGVRKNLSVLGKKNINIWLSPNFTPRPEELSF